MWILRHCRPPCSHWISPIGISSGGSNKVNPPAIRISKVSTATSKAIKEVCWYKYQTFRHDNTASKAGTSEMSYLEGSERSNSVSHRLAKSVSDVGWGGFRRQLTYKAEWYGKQLVVVDRFYPSSQLCSCCGMIWSGTKDLSVREWSYPNCGAKHDRDINAARNILNEGLRLLAQ